MSLLERLKARTRPSDLSSPISAPIANGLQSSSVPTGSTWSAARGEVTRAVGSSRDLERILALPRRPLPSPSQLETLVKKWTAKLGKDRKAMGLGPCRCAEYKRQCATSLLPVQAWALEEISTYGGLLGPITVGGGKTLLDMLAPMAIQDCSVAVLLIPAFVRVQFVEVDWEFYEQHWKLPHRVGERFIEPNVPALHVLAYSELSGASNTDRLNAINPDLIILDEAHMLKSAQTARGKRFNRFMKDHPKVRLAAWSGTLTSKTMADYAHFAEGALNEGSPVPTHYPTMLEWSGALDPIAVGEMPTPPGALMKFCNEGESLRSAWQRRLCETPGVVSSPDRGSCDAALNFFERKVTIPKAVQDAYDKFNHSWEREDGERIITALDKGRYLRQLASGLYTRWRWPRNEPLPVRKKWIEVRKFWHRELAEKLKSSKEFMDSPLLLTKAAIRWHDGYVHIERKEDGSEKERQVIPPHHKHGPQPTWDADNWLEWRSVRDTAAPETEAVWIDDFLARDAASWASSEVGIVWYEHVAFGAAVSKLANIPQFGPGEDAGRAILAERGARSVVASIRSHGTGKNLQPFCRNLVANPPSDGATWEQLIGRTHRTGQLADEVSVHVYRHAPAMIDALDKAKNLASHIQGTFGGVQKLLSASFLWRCGP